MNVMLKSHLRVEGPKERFHCGGRLAAVRKPQRHRHEHRAPWPQPVKLSQRGGERGVLRVCPPRAGWGGGTGCRLVDGDHGAVAGRDDDRRRRSGHSGGGTTGVLLREIHGPGKGRRAGKVEVKGTRKLGKGLAV